jgi:hypothetical protein
MRLKEYNTEQPQSLHANIKDLPRETFTPGVKRGRKKTKKCQLKRILPMINSDSGRSNTNSAQICIRM